MQLLSPEKFQEQFDSSESSDGNGVDCHYYDCGTYGIKTFKSQWKANQAYETQKAIHSDGLAPEVLSEMFTINSTTTHYDKFDIQWVVPMPLHCFATEKARPINDDFLEMVDDMRDADLAKGGNGWIEYFVKHKAFQKTDLSKENNKLKKRLRKAGWFDSDDHYGNYGVLPNGEHVVIDTGAIQKDAESWDNSCTCSDCVGSDSDF